jgi:DNA-binding Xre family transcriptional regulator
MVKKTTFTESLRDAVQNAPVSRYRMSQATGISQGNLSHFVHGKRGLSMHNLDVLCEYLQLSLVQTKGKGR